MRIIIVKWLKGVAAMSENLRDSIIKKAKQITEGSKEKEYQPGLAYEKFKKEKEKWMQSDSSYLKTLKELIDKISRSR